MTMGTLAVMETAREAWSESGAAPRFGEEDDAPVSGSRAERYQVLLHVDRGTLAGEGEPGRSEMEDGTAVSGETSRWLSCDAGLGGCPGGGVRLMSLFNLSICSVPAT